MAHGPKPISPADTVEPPRSIFDLDGAKDGDGRTFAAGALVGASLFGLQRLAHRYGFFFSAIGTAPHLAAFAGTVFAEVQQAGGFDPVDPGLAMTKCVYELLERVWSPAADPPSMVHGARAALGALATDPRCFALLSEGEIAGSNYPAYHDGIELYWVRAWRIADESGTLEPALLPAHLVHPGFGNLHPEQNFVPTLSTGLAAGSRADDAILRGLYEVVERDAAAAGWLARIAPRRIDPQDRFSPAARDVLASLAVDGFDVAFLDLTLDVPIPVVLAIIRNPRREEAFAAALGLGCNLARPRAAEKALNEALQVMLKHWEFPGGTGIARREGAPDLAQRAALDSMLATACNLNLPAEEDVAGDLAETGTEADLRRCLGMLRARGHEVYVADLTPPLAEAGFRLLRVFVAGLQPMLYEETLRRLANERLRVLPQRLGRALGPVPERDFDLGLHPFVRQELT